MATDPIKDGIVNMFDAAHGVADHLLKPIKPVDSVVHGVAIGIKNWLCDEHPGKKCDCGPSKDEKKKPDDHKGCDEPHGKGYGGDHFDNRDSNKNNKNTGNISIQGGDYKGAA